MYSFNTVVINLLIFKLDNRERSLKIKLKSSFIMALSYSTTCDTHFLL